MPPQLCCSSSDVDRWYGDVTIVLFLNKVTISENVNPGLDRVPVPQPPDHPRKRTNRAYQNELDCERKSLMTRKMQFYVA